MVVAAADMQATAIVAVMTVVLRATALAVVTVVIPALAMGAMAAMVVIAATTAAASARLIARHVLIRRHPLLTPHHERSTVPRQIARVMAKIACLHTSIVTPLRVVILRIVASVVLHRVKIAHHVLALIVRPSMIVRIVVVARSAAARVTVIRVQPGAAMIAPRRVLSAVIVPFMMSCRFSAHRA